MKEASKKYSVYIVRCNDNTLYTGVSNDVEKRIKAHNSLKSGAKYTRSRRPVTLVYSKSFKTKTSALKKEYEVKQLSKLNKEKLFI